SVPIQVAHLHLKRVAPQWKPTKVPRVGIREGRPRAVVQPTAEQKIAGARLTSKVTGIPGEGHVAIGWRAGREVVAGEARPPAVIQAEPEGALTKRPDENRLGIPWRRKDRPHPGHAQLRRGEGVSSPAFAIAT